MDDGSLCGFWNASIHGDISSVKDVKTEVGRSLFLVGISRSERENYLSLVDLLQSRVISLIRFPFQISSMHCLSTESLVPGLEEKHHLNYFCGILAAGGQGGNLVLVDLQLDQIDRLQSPVEPRQLVSLHKENPGNEAELLQLRNRCIKEGSFLYLELTGMYL